MSIGNFGGVLGSAAGAPLSQTKGSSLERASRETNAQKAELDNRLKTEKAAGVGETTEDSGTSDRDADGRSILEYPQEKEKNDQKEKKRQGKDSSGQAGNSLDLSG